MLHGMESSKAYPSTSRAWSLTRLGFGAMSYSARDHVKEQPTTGFTAIDVDAGSWDS